MTISSIFWGTTPNGEEAVRKTLDEKALIIRTAWLYSAHGNNFIKTMLNLMKEKPGLTVIDEQIGTPTWTNGLARVIWIALDKTSFWQALDIKPTHWRVQLRSMLKELG